MQALVNQIGDCLRADGFSVEDLGPPPRRDAIIWAVSHRAEEPEVRLMIAQDMNGHPELWVQAFPDYAAHFVVPIVAAIGDARETVLQRLRTERLASRS